MLSSINRMQNNTSVYLFFRCVGHTSIRCIKDKIAFQYVYNVRDAWHRYSFVVYAYVSFE